MRNLKRIAILMIVLLFSITVIGCGSKTVASVNGEKISRTDLDKRMKKIKMSMESQGVSFQGEQGQSMLKAMEQQALADMISQKLLIQAAKKEGVYPSDSEIKKALEQIIASFGGEKKFNEELKKMDYTKKDVEALWADNVARTKLFDKVTANVKVTDQEIKQEYDKNKANYKDPAKIKARAILIKFDDPSQAGAGAPAVGRSEQDAKKLADDIVKKLDGGTDFAALAKEKSEDDATKNDGGLIKDQSGKSPYARGTVMLPPEFDQAATGLKVGQYTKAPVKTSLGYYIIKLEGLTPEKQLTFEEAKEKIAAQLPLDKKQQAFNEYAFQLETKAKIVNNLAKEAPQQAAPQQGAPQQEAPQQGAPQQGAPQQGAPQSGGQLPAGHPPINQ